MDEFVTAALEIMDQASVIPRKFFRSKVAVAQKHDQTPVTIADKETEWFIREKLAARFPNHKIIGEEFGRNTHADSNESRYEWVIDPIDGTRSFISGQPLYGMLLALLRDGVAILGVVQMPELNETYLGYNHQATLNRHQRLRCSTITRLENACLYINGGESILDNSPKLFAKLLNSPKLCRLSYDCYSHVLVASGHVDAVLDRDLQPYDFLPLAPIIEGAGGIITDWSGKPLGLHSDGRIITAATPELHNELLGLINA